jgi:hypothetical protein
MSVEEKKPDDNLGGVRHDSRGNAVWQWAVDSGKQALDSTSRLLKRLDVPGLKLEGDTAAKPDRQAGYNPYGATTGAARPGAVPPAAARAAAAKPAAATKPGAGKASAPSLWQRLFRRR